MDRHELLDLVRKYHLPVDPSVLKDVFADEEQGRLLAEWTKSHITRDTLLTKDELDAYAVPNANGGSWLTRSQLPPGPAQWEDRKLAGGDRRVDCAGPTRT